MLLPHALAADPGPDASMPLTSQWSKLCRTDSGGSREATAKALLRAGYGARCSDAMEPPRSSGSAKAQEREELSVDRAASVASRRLLEVSAHATWRLC